MEILSYSDLPQEIQDKIGKIIELLLNVQDSLDDFERALTDNNFTPGKYFDREDPMAITLSEGIKDVMIEFDWVMSFMGLPPVYQKVQQLKSKTKRKPNIPDLGLLPKRPDRCGNK